MNTAAVLDVVVKAQTSKASVELKKFEKTLKQTAKSAKDTDRNFEVANKKVTTFGSSISDTNQRAMLFKNTVGLIKFPALIAGLGGAAQAAAAAAAGVGGLASALAPLSGLLAAYPALIGAFGQAMGVTAVAGLSDVTDAVGGLNEKLDETADEFKALSPQAQEFARGLQAAKAPLLDIQKTVQRSLFEGLNQGLSAASKNMPVLKSVAKDTASVMGDLAREAGRFAGREGFGKDFAEVGENNAQLLGRLGQAGMHFADALRHVVVVSQPLIDFLGRGVVKLGEWLEAESKAGRESGRMAEFFERTEKVVRQLVNIGGSLGKVFLDIGHAARPLGEDIMRELVKQAEALSDWTGSHGGELRKYFEDAKKPLWEVGRLIGDLVKGFFELSNTPGLTGLIRQFRKELLPVVLEMTKQTTKAFGPVLIDTLVQVGKLLTNFLGTSGPLTHFVKLLGTAAEALNNLFESIPALATAAASALAGFSIMKLLGISKLLGSSGKLGTMIGTRFGTTLGNAAGPIAVGLIGSALAGIEVGKKLDIGQTDIGEAFAEQFDIARNRAERLVEFMKKHPGMEAGDALREMSRIAREELGEVRDQIDRLQNTWGLSLHEINQQTRRNMKMIANTLGLESKRGRQAISDNFFAAMEAIENSMKSGEISAKKGAKAIHNVLVKQLKSYGIKDVEGFLNRQEQASQAHQGGGVSGLASGGLAAMVPGRSSGDKHTLSIDGVPKARVESGEGVFVGNRKMMGAAAAANAAVPRFAEGGGLDFALGPYTIPPIQYDPDHAGGNSHWHISGSPPSWVVAIGHKLQQMGFMVGEHPAFGGVAPGVHGNYGPTDHYHAGAIDVNSAANETRAETARVAALLGGAGGIAAAVEKLKLPRFSSDFGLGALVATGLNNMAGGVETVMNKRLAAQAPGETAGVSLAGGSAAENAALGHKMLVMKPGRYKKDADTMTWGPWGESEWPAYNRLIMSESGWSTTATNPSSGAYGIPQSLPGSKMATAGSDWRTNAATQIAWGLDYIRDPAQGGYGSPSNVPLGGYLLGGLLKLAEGGFAWGDWFPRLGSKDKDERQHAQQRILEQIGRFGISRTWLDTLSTGTDALAKQQEYADLAGGLNITDDNDNLIPGIFADKSEHGWLTQARQEAWELRQNLIKARGPILEDIDTFDGKDGLIRKAERRLTEVKQALKKAKDDLDQLLDDIQKQRDIIEDAKKKLEKPNLSNAQKKHQEDRIERAQGEIEKLTKGDPQAKLEDAIARSTYERDALGDPILVAMADKLTQLKEIKAGIEGDSYTDDATGLGFSGLATIQGTGRPDSLMPMPDNLQSIFGGELHSIQSRLLEMIPEAKPGDSVIDQLEAALALAGLTADLSDDISAQSQIVTYWEEELARLQSSGGSAQDIASAANSLSSARDALAGLQETTAGGSEADSLKLEALMAENARLRMSAQQAGTFAGFFKQFSAMPQFATGGVMSQTGPALVHGREGIFTPEQMAALGGRGDVNVNVNLDGMDVVVETWIDGVLAKETRKALSRGPTVGRRTS